MSQARFATAINCMDGRTQLPVIEWMKKEFGVEYVDSITEPGPVRILAEPAEVAESIRQRVRISVERHGSKAVALVAHHDCAGNPVDRKTQLAQLRAAIETVCGWGFPVEVVGLWVGEDWGVQRVE